MFSIPTVSMDGVRTATSYKTSTPATIHFTPTVCADRQFPTTTLRSFPTAVRSYVELISNRRIFPYTGSTVSYTSSRTESTFPTTTTTTTTTTTITTTSTSSFSNPVIGTIYKWSTYTTTSITFWSFASAVHPITTPCTTDRATVTYASQCAPSNIISARDDHAVSISWDQDSHKWAKPGPSFNSDLMRKAFQSPSVCCQLCVDNAASGCAASEWTGTWDEG
ncbi:hypothetical protein V8F06_012482 [Rhypophila decipiens]